MKKLFFGAILLLFCNYSLAQNNVTCNEPDSPSASDTYKNKFRRPFFWAPYEGNNIVTTKTIMANVVIPNDDNGQGGLPNSPDVIQRVHAFIDSLNYRLSHVEPRGYPVYFNNPSVEDIPQISDTKIRIELNEIIFFNNTATYQTNYSHGPFFQEHPEAINFYNFVFVYDTYGHPTPYGTTVSVGVSPTPFSIVSQPTINNAIHELSHTMGLLHTTDYALTSPISISEIKEINHYDFLYDVYGTVNNPELLPGGTCNVIPFYPSPNYMRLFNFCFFDNFSYGANPMMCQRGNNRYISALQAGRYHRDLSLIEQQFNNATSSPNIVHKFIKEKYPADQNFVIQAGEYQTWDFAIKMYQNIEIMPGATLEIKCKVYMPLNGRIIVHPGAQLIIDGGVVTCAHDGFWQGIEAEGISSTVGAVSVVTVKNGGLVENANVGIRNAGMSSTGRINWNSIGGIINTDNAIFLNNKKSIELFRFNQLSNYTYNFEDADFIWNDDYKADLTNTHFSIWGLNNVSIKYCNFYDNRTNKLSEYIQANRRGNSGIYSLDAELYIYQCEFNDLDFGVYSSNAETENFVNVSFSNFNNNLFGITLLNIRTPYIFQNTFNFDDNANSFISQLITNNNITPYGIQFIKTYELFCSGNTFNQNTDLIATIGIASSHLGPYENVIEHNIFNSVNVPNLAQGINRRQNQDFSYSGLEFLCNVYNNAFRDHYVVPTTDQNSSPINPYLYGVKDITGTPIVPTGNKHTAIPYPIGGNYYNTTANTVTYYHHNSSDETPVYITSNIFGVNTNNSAFCSGGDGNGNPPVYLVDTTFEGREYYRSRIINYSDSLTLRKNELSNLVNGGNTDLLISEINNVTPNTKTDLHQLLLSHSPYLTEDVIKLAINNDTVKYPHPWAYDLILNNIDVAKNNQDFIDFLSTKNHPLPANMINSIVAYADITPYSDFMDRKAELSSFSKERDYAFNSLIYAYKANSTDSTFIDSTKILIIQKNDLMYQTRIIDIELQKGNYNIVNEMLVGLKNNITMYPAYLEQEILDFIDFKTKLVEIESKEGGLLNISKENKSFLYSMAKSGTGIAKYEAQEILCFFYGDCGNYNLKLDLSSTNKTKQNTDINFLITEDFELKLYPNPANEWVGIEVPFSSNEMTLLINDINGRLVHYSILNKPFLIIETSTFEKGTYLVNLIDENGQNVKTKKLIISH
ncbi:MAG: T9SS type A sorting domain-containing protein [Putridiphycobacter sp.]